MKTVAIVGAGPAGIVAAKVFLSNEDFAVTVYEKGHDLGGIWRLDEDTQDGYLSPQTPTNLSRFTVSFSDLDWNEVDIRSKHASGLQEVSISQPVPMFPKAWQVTRYLKAYRDRYITKTAFLFNREVVKAERCMQLARGAKPFWRVTSRNKDGEEHVKDHDYLIVASGFFSSPRPLKQDVPGIGDDSSKLGISNVHSSRFRSLRGLFPDETKAAGKTILLIGGGNSAGETAAAVASQLSDALWSTDRDKWKLYEGCKIVHITPRPLYAVPSFVEYESGSKAFMPLDFKFYDFAKRPAMDSYAGVVPAPVRDIVHGAIQGLVGGDQSHLGSEALIAEPKGDDRPTPYVALSESYPQFVQDGLIEVVKGRVKDVAAIEEGVASATIENGDQQLSIGNIGAIVYATGYTPSTALNFLEDDIKQPLQYDPSNMRLPLILEQWQTMNNSVPTVAFLGFYEGPYWGVMEMQAKLVEDRWANESQPASQRPYEEAGKLLDLRKSMQEKAIDVPQYWFGDYIGYLEDISKHLGMKRNNGPFGEREGCQLSARHIFVDTDKHQAEAIVADLYRTWQACLHDGKYAARAAFRALQGTWAITRNIESAHAAYSGLFTGSANFHPRFPTKDKSGKLFDFEYLYIEKGTFKSKNNAITMQASRRYVYRYSEADDQLSVWFIKPDSELEVDYLFHNLDFVGPEAARQAGALVAKADHLCVEDMYWTQYTLPMQAIVLDNFEVKHTVKGPQKDYVATAKYRRPAPACIKNSSSP